MYMVVQLHVQFTAIDEGQLNTSLVIVINIKRSEYTTFNNLFLAVMILLFSCFIS